MRPPGRHATANPRPDRLHDPRRQGAATGAPRGRGSARPLVGVAGVEDESGQHPHARKGDDGASAPSRRRRRRCRPARTAVLILPSGRLFLSPPSVSLLRRLCRGSQGHARKFSPAPARQGTGERGCTGLPTACPPSPAAGHPVRRRSAPDCLAPPPPGGQKGSRRAARQTGAGRPGSTPASTGGIRSSRDPVGCDVIGQQGIVPSPRPIASEASTYRRRRRRTRRPATAGTACTLPKRTLTARPSDPRPAHQRPWREEAAGPERQHRPGAEQGSRRHLGHHQAGVCAIRKG